MTSGRGALVGLGVGALAASLLVGVPLALALAGDEGEVNVLGNVLFLVVPLVAVGAAGGAALASGRGATADSTGRRLHTTGLVIVAVVAAVLLGLWGTTGIF